jgi:hypothetical protein
MSDDRSLHLKRQILEEIWEEIGSLHGKDLDDYLASIGLNRQDLLKQYSNAVSAAIAAPKRALFEDARRRLREKNTVESAKILAFDIAKKKQIVAAVRDHADSTREMTIAARNRKIEDEGDLDVFLEACLRLGVIDSDGNLKE